MERLLRIFVLLVALMLASSVAAASDLPVEVVQLDGWEGQNGKPEDSYAYSLTHKETQSRIEILLRVLARQNLAGTLYQGFHDSIQKDDKVNLASGLEDRVYTLNDGESLLGKYAEYIFTSEVVPIRVSVFSFVVGETAVFVIGYYAEANSDEGLEAFRKLIEGMVKTSGTDGSGAEG